MRRIILIITTFCAATCLSAQLPRYEFRHFFKIGNAATFGQRPIRVQDSDGIEIGIWNASTADLLQFSPTFGWQTKRGDLCEVAITNWSFRAQETIDVANQGLVSGSIHTTNLSAKFSYFARFLKTKDHLVSLLLGFEAMPRFDRYDYRPGLTTEFAEHRQNVSFAANLAPRIAFYPQSRFFADITGIITLAEYHFSSLLFPGFTPAANIHSSWLGILEGSFGLTASAGIRF